MQIWLEHISTCQLFLKISLNTRGVLNMWCQRLQNRFLCKLVLLLSRLSPDVIYLLIIAPPSDGRLQNAQTFPKLKTQKFSLCDNFLHFGIFEKVFFYFISTIQHTQLNSGLAYMGLHKIANQRISIYLMTLMDVLFGSQKAFCKG